MSVRKKDNHEEKVKKKRKKKNNLYIELDFEKLDNRMEKSSDYSIELYQ